MAKSMTFKSNSAQVIYDCLIKAGIQVEVISKRFKLMKITHQGASFFIKGTSFSVNSQPSSLIANNKFLTKKVLVSANIPTPKSYLCHSATQARQIIQEKKLFPCVLKPAKGAHGTKVYANIETFKELDAILPYLFTGKGAKDILIEDFILGSDYRVMVVGDKVSAIMERIPAHVIGDGIHTIRQLITEFNRNPQVGEKYEKPMCKIIRNGEVARNLLKKNLTFASVPSMNQQVFLRQNANISTGGIGKNATTTAPKIVSTLAIKAAKAIGMNITGVDILYDPLAKKAYVLELNDQPGIDIHHYPVIGQPQNVAQDIINYLLQRLDHHSNLETNDDKPHLSQYALTH